MALAQTSTLADALSDILHAEQIGIFHSMAEADTYVNPRLAEIGRPLQKMIGSAQRREGDLADLIGQLGGLVGPPGVARESQYLAYLSMAYMLPKMILEREQSIVRYQQVLAAAPGAEPAAEDLLRAHLAELNEELACLKSARQTP